MSDPPSLPALIQAALERKGRGKLFLAKDFLHLGSRAAVDQALSRLARAGTIENPARGLYYCPRLVERLNIRVPLDPDAVAAALARQTSSRVVPAGELALHRLGLSNQVPAKPVYATDGRSRKLKVAGTVVILKHVAARHLPSHPRSALVMQALRHLGPDGLDARLIARLRLTLTPADRRQLLEDARYTTAWLFDLVRQIAAPPPRRKK